MHRAVIIGSGNFGSVVAKFVGTTVAAQPALFVPTVNMWVYDEQLKLDPYAGRGLCAVINEVHENVKYLPGFKLPSNVVAVPDLVEAVKDATLLIFVLPHEFLARTLQTIAPHVSSSARAISLIKGLDFDDQGVVLLSQRINQALNIPCSVMMGANVASQLAKGEPSEATIGYTDEESASLFKALFNQPNYVVNTVPDVSGVELCGALKNIVALAAGFVDGLGLGDNTKASIIRIGLNEMKRFAERYFSPAFPDTYLESCGVADLITTCYAGRNRMCAEAFVKTGKSFDELEKEMLNGQKLQGTLTAKEVYIILERRGDLAMFPLFTHVHDIAFNAMSPKEVATTFWKVQNL